MTWVRWPYNERKKTFWHVLDDYVEQTACGITIGIDAEYQRVFPRHGLRCGACEAEKRNEERGRR